MWLQGRYFLEAMMVALSHFGSGMSGKKSKAEYLTRPLMEEAEEQNKPLSEEELQKQRELFVARLEAMKTNFEINHPKNKESE